MAAKYYQKNKEILQRRAHENYQSFPEEENIQKAGVCP